MTDGIVTVAPLGAGCDEVLFIPASTRTRLHGAFFHARTMADEPEPYYLRILTRCNVAGLKLRPGATLRVAPDKLRVVAHLVRCGTGRPADEYTRTAVELFMLMNR